MAKRHPVPATRPPSKTQAECAKNKLNLTQSDLHMLFSYNPKTGALIWKLGRNRGKPAGGYNTNGEPRVMVAGRSLSMRAIIWLYQTGQHADGEVQQVDGDEQNLRWSNLRLVTRSQRAAGARLNTRNTSGYKGVSYSARHGKWRAALKHAGQSKTIDYYDDAEVAAAAYVQAASQIWGSYLRNA